MKRSTLIGLALIALFGFAATASAKDKKQDSHKNKPSSKQSSKQSGKSNKSKLSFADQLLKQIEKDISNGHGKGHKYSLEDWKHEEDQFPTKPMFPLDPGRGDGKSNPVTRLPFRPGFNWVGHHWEREIAPSTGPKHWEHIDGKWQLVPTKKPNLKPGSKHLTTLPVGISVTETRSWTKLNAN